MEEHTPVKYQEMRQMVDTAKIIPSMFQVCIQIHAHIKKTLQVYEMNNLIIIIGGYVVHSYGRLVHHEHVITRGDQVLPPFGVTGPGRMDCIRNAQVPARFGFDGTSPPNNLVNQSVGDGDQMDILLFNQSYLSMDNFNNVEGFCRGVNRNPFFYLYLSQGIYLPYVYAHIERSLAY